MARPSLWARSQPTKSSTSALRHIQVGKRRKPRSASSASRSARRAAHVAIDAVGVGPVALDRDRGEAVLGDQALGDARALAVELVRSVAGLAEQHDARVADQREQRVVVAMVAGERVRLAPERVEHRVLAERQRQRRGHGLNLPAAASGCCDAGRWASNQSAASSRDGLERSRLLEQVAGARRRRSADAGSAASPPRARLSASTSRSRLADEQQRRRASRTGSRSAARSGRPPRETTARDRVAGRGRRAQRRRGAGRRAEVADRQPACRRLLERPARHVLKSPGQQRDVEDELAPTRLLVASAGRTGASRGRPR